MSILIKSTNRKQSLVGLDTNLNWKAPSEMELSGTKDTLFSLGLHGVSCFCRPAPSTYSSDCIWPDMAGTAIKKRTFSVCFLPGESPSSTKPRCVNPYGSGICGLVANQPVYQWYFSVGNISGSIICGEWLFKKKFKIVEIYQVFFLHLLKE